MRHSLTLLFLIFSASLSAQSVQQFDIVSFSLPSTWKKEAQQDWLAYRVENPSKKSYARILMYPSLPSSGNPESDFQKEWNDLIVTQYKPGTTINENLSENNDGWKAKIRVAPFQHNLVNQAVILLMLTDGKKKMSFIFLTNSEEFEKDFGSSLVFGSAPLKTKIPPQNMVNSPSASVQIDKKVVDKNPL